MTHPIVTERTTKPAHELVAGDVIADDLYDEPTPVLGVHEFEECGHAAILAVVRDAQGCAFAREFDYDAPVPVDAVADEKRAGQISAVRELADWLAANPDVPMPELVVHRHLQNIGDLQNADGSEAENLAFVRALAARIGVETDERLDDRTVLRHRINEHVRYELFAWHKGGREGGAELERLRARVAELEAANAKPVEAPVDEALVENAEVGS